MININSLESLQDKMKIESNSKNSKIKLNKKLKFKMILSKEITILSLKLMNNKRRKLNKVNPALLSIMCRQLWTDWQFPNVFLSSNNKK
jgi:hypothetical protein